tara:strand:- start:2790 stop:3284 length:495 start_codon:yes stop_codon:yes gene_type:complete
MTEKDKHRRLAAFMLGDTYCMTLTSNLNAVTESLTSFRIIPGTKPFFSGNARLGRDLVSYFHLPTFLGLKRSDESSNPDLPRDFILRDPLSSSMIGLQTDGVVGFIPVVELSDADPSDLNIPASLSPFCTGAVSYQSRLWALITLDYILRDANFRSVELPVQRP